MNRFAHPLYLHLSINLTFPVHVQINSTALGQAIAKNHMDIAMLLIECFDANVNFSLNLPDGKPSNCSPLLVAATLSSPQSHAAVVRLMELGANIFAHSKVINLSLNLSVHLTHQPIIVFLAFAMCNQTKYCSHSTASYCC